MSDYLDPVEQRLHDDAERLLHAHGTQAPIQRILAEHQEHRRRRTACGVVLGVALAAGVVGLARFSPTQRADRAVDGPSTVPNRELVAVEPARSGDSMLGSGNQRDPGQRSAAVRVVTQLGGTGSQAVLFLVAEPGGERPRVFVTGVYLPERTEQKKLSDFSAAEQAAIRQVLGMNEAVTLHEPI